MIKSSFVDFSLKSLFYSPNTHSPRHIHWDSKAHGIMKREDIFTHKQYVLVVNSTINVQIRAIETQQKSKIYRDSGKILFSMWLLRNSTLRTSESQVNLV